jgi:hypothetical protein
MSYQVRKPYIIVNGQRLFTATEAPQRLPFCDQCDTLAATIAPLHTELALDKWRNWFAFPKFSYQEDAFMGCEKHPVEPKIRFLDGRTEPFVRFPKKRWQRLIEWEAVSIAAVLAVVVAIVIEFLRKL